jgi:hypothetical protein
MQESRRECAPKIAEIAHFDWLWRSLLEGAERSALIRNLALQRVIADDRLAEC